MAELSTYLLDPRSDGLTHRQQLIINEYRGRTGTEGVVTHTAAVLHTTDIATTVTADQ